MGNEKPGQGNDPTDNPSGKKEEYIVVDERKLRIDNLKPGNVDFFKDIDTATVELLNGAGQVREKLVSLVKGFNEEIGSIDGIDDNGVKEIKNKLNEKLNSAKNRFIKGQEKDVAGLINDIENSFNQFKKQTPKGDQFEAGIVAIGNMKDRNKYLAQN